MSSYEELKKQNEELKKQLAETKKQLAEEQEISVSKSIQNALDYIEESEMGGQVDTTDSWYPVYESLQELQEKVIDEEEWAK